MLQSSFTKLFGDLCYSPRAEPRSASVRYTVNLRSPFKKNGSLIESKPLNFPLSVMILELRRIHKNLTQISTENGKSSLNS